MTNSTPPQKDLTQSQDCATFAVDIKNQIKLSHQRAFSAVNQEMILLYFVTCVMIHKKQAELGWGAKVIDTLSMDILPKEFESSLPTIRLSGKLRVG